MKPKFQSFFTEVLLVIMLLTGKFPNWVYFTILAVSLIQIVHLIVYTVKKSKADKPLTND
jgi:hypothetical protein